jgi:methylglutaconyl-CoA hydratase
VTASSETLLIEKEGPLVWFKLNRPKVLNSLDSGLLHAIKAACGEIKADKSVLVVAIIGAGTKVFCAGADLAERKTLSEAEIVDYHALIQSTMLAVESLPQTVIAAINGSAYGGGVELALACDLRVIVRNALLQMTEVRLGIIPGAGGTQRLPRLIGKTRAKEMILAAAPINAQTAYQYGLVNRIVDEDPSQTASFHQPLIDQVKDFAASLTCAAPLALRQAKAAIDSGCERDLLGGLAMETKAYLKLLNTKDRLEGLAAFAEKRKPSYAGK